MTLTLPDNLPELYALIGSMPRGDTPAAWWACNAPEALEAWDRYTEDSRAWYATWNRLLKNAKLPENTRIRTYGSDTLTGLLPPPGAGRIPRGWRKTPHGYLVPRRRTREEKASEANTLFDRVRVIPRAVDYYDDVPTALWTTNPDKAYPVHMRKPATMVLVFVGHDPEQADPPFELGERWTRMTMSLFHLLLEHDRPVGIH